MAFVLPLQTCMWLVALLWTTRAQPAESQPVHLPLFRTTSSTRSALGTRADGGLFNEANSFYYTTITVGTPPQPLNMLLSSITGDLLLASTDCSSGCSSTSVLYNRTASSTSSTTGLLALPDFGVVPVSGTFVNDTVRFAGLSVPQVPFVDVRTIESGIVGDPVSGVLGLAGSALAQSVDTPPFWQRAPNMTMGGAPEFGMWLSRSPDSNNAPAPGGVFTLGGTNSSLFSGDIEFLDVVGAQNSYWSLTLSAMTIQGKSIPITFSTNLAAFDFGSTYIGGPATDVESFWAAVPGARVIIDNPNLTGFWEYPCSTTLHVSLSFGGRTWSMNPEDMNAGPIASGSDMCVGGLYEAVFLTGPSWIIGAGFLRNVYSVFRLEPPAVGLATLAGEASEGAGDTGGGGGGGGSKKKLNIGAIAGGAAGGAVVLLAGCVLLLACLRRRGRKSKEPNPDLGVPGKYPDAPMDSPPLPALAFDSPSNMTTTQGGTVSQYLPGAPHDGFTQAPGLHTGPTLNTMATSQGGTVSRYYATTVDAGSASNTASTPTLSGDGPIALRANVRMLPS